MIWDDAGFQKTYRERLRHVHTSGDAEAQAQAMAFQAEAARAGGSNGEHFTQRAGAAAAAMLSGYVRGALEAFEQTLATVETDLEDADVNALRASLEQEIARRAKLLPAALRDFNKPAAPPALMRAILQQAPVKARQLLAERVAATRERVCACVQVSELPDRAIFISHDVRDAALAESLTSVIRAAIGNDIAVYTFGDLPGMQSGRDGFERVLTQLKRNRMTLSLFTPHSIGDPMLWWTLGIAQGEGKPAFALRTAGVGDDAVLPLRRDQVIHLAQRDEIARLLKAIQTEVRRRGNDLSDLDLEALLREAAR